jgi:hypothetical protein
VIQYCLAFLKNVPVQGGNYLQDAVGCLVVSTSFSYVVAKDTAQTAPHGHGTLPRIRCATIDGTFA